MFNRDRDRDIEIHRKLDLILAILQKEEKEITNMALDLTALNTAVANETSVNTSVLALIQGLTAQITTLIANSGNTVDPTALAAIVAQINANASALTAAVTANTPVSTTQASATK